MTAHLFPLIAPVLDLRKALIRGSLGSLNPFPWSMMTGNCLGWVVYGYYTADPFVTAANIPGLILSLWLNLGAAKLQYLELYNSRKRTPANEHWDASPDEDDAGSHMSGNQSIVSSLVSSSPEAESLVMVEQERHLLRILCAWGAVIVWAGWFSAADPATTIGLVVNVNLVFFYGAPLQTITKVIAQGNSDSIHVPTMIMNWTNTTFWILYGLAKHDMVIVVPNGAGLTLGLLQGLLTLTYPRSSSSSTHELVAAEPPPEEVVPEVASVHEVL